MIDSHTPYTPPTPVLPREEKKVALLKKRHIIAALLCSVGIFFIGLYIGYTKDFFIDKVAYAFNVKNAVASNTNLDEFWKVWQLLDEKYPHASDYSTEERIQGAISGLVASMEDPYTMYFSPEESKLFNEEVSGSFSGIGVEIGMKDGLLVVIAPLKNSPAEKAGLKTGDFIMKINDTLVTEMTLDETIRAIRGDQGTIVNITIARKNTPEPITLSIMRDIISIPTIDEKVLDGAYLISLYNFNASAAELFHKALLNAKQLNQKNIIIDLRGNPGGYLEGAISVASEFLPEGTLIVTEDYGSEKKITHRSYGYNTINSDTRVVLLIDEGSASASEIVAGAFKDHNRATVIGKTSFGKGSVQELIQVTNKTSVKITVANWLTPNGAVITKKGIQPNIEVTEKTTKNTEGDTTDPILDRALEFIKTGK